MSSTEIEILKKHFDDCQRDFDALSVELERRNDALRAIAAHLSLADDTPMQVLVDTALKMIELGLQKHLDDNSPPDRG